MAKKARYHVVKNKQKGGWDIKKEGASRASSNRPTKKEAKKKGIEIARKQKPSQLIIHKKNGRIQEERTYGKDPYPPKG